MANVLRQVPLVLAVSVLSSSMFQINMGAKNHAILMPDANKNLALNSIVGAAFGGKNDIRIPLGSADDE